MGTSGLFDLERHFAFYGAYHRNPINIAIHMLFVWPIFFTALLILYFTPSLFNIPLIDLSLFGHDLILILNVGFLLTLIYAVFYVCLDVKAGSLAALLCFICWVVSSYLGGRMDFSLAWKFPSYNATNLQEISISSHLYLVVLGAAAFILGALAITVLRGRGFVELQSLLHDKLRRLLQMACSSSDVDLRRPTSILKAFSILEDLVVLVAQVACWTGQFIGHGVFEKRAPALLDNLSQAFLMAPFFVLLEALQKVFAYEPYPGFHAAVRARIEAEINDWEDKKQKLIS
ncbi:unnamed protein product [Thlaspi arvense]|uniref:Uncharacterized protein n=1 Tax=Thlaspi arvense TaxID=13288 RepID=A0AAU9RKD5_THLAR|nr:unnamed protein product [Thlaspi arvense]